MWAESSREGGAAFLGFSIGLLLPLLAMHAAPLLMTQGFRDFDPQWPAPSNSYKVVSRWWSLAFVRESRLLVSPTIFFIPLIVSDLSAEELSSFVAYEASFYLQGSFRMRLGSTTLWAMMVKALDKITIPWSLYTVSTIYVLYSFSTVSAMLHAAALPILAYPLWWVRVEHLWVWIMWGVWRLGPGPVPTCTPTHIPSGLHLPMANTKTIYSCTAVSCASCEGFKPFVVIVL